MIQNSWQNCLYPFWLQFMFNIQTIKCMQYSELVVIQTRSQLHNEINTHTEHLVQKHNNFL